MSDRLDAMIAELEEQLGRAQQHAKKMRETLPESLGWSQPHDRAWLAEAVAEAEQMVRDAEERLTEGCRIVARVRGRKSLCICGRPIDDPCQECE